MAKSTPAPAILTEAHYDALQAALDQLQHLPGVMDKAERCGVDCAEYRKMNEYAVESLNKIKSEWFPKGRPRQ